MATQLWFHGTNKHNATLIQKEGFKIGTYFATQLEDALVYGGNHIFTVSVDFNNPPLRWQAICSNHISATTITKYEIFTKNTK